MDQPTVVFVLVPDLFFRSKIVATGKVISASLRILETADQLEREIPREPPLAVIIDLSADLFDPMEVAGRLRLLSDPHRPTLIGFYPHVDQQLRERALKAGYDHVVPRSVLSRQLPRILAGDFSVLPPA